MLVISKSAISIAVFLRVLCSASPVQNVLHKVSEQDEFDLEPSGRYAFSGITTFHQLPTQECLTGEGPYGDILIIGMPFDTATSYRTGTRMGPNGIRQGSRAVSLAGSYNYRQSLNPFEDWATVIDCGDMPISPFDNAVAFAQIEDWYSRLLSQEVVSPDHGIQSAKTGLVHPKIVTLGGDHSITLPILRALNATYGPVSIFHIDAHIDTWDPQVFAGARGSPSKQAAFADGTPLFHASREGLITTTNVHVGIRSLLDSARDLRVDEECGFRIIPASAVFEEGGDGGGGGGGGIRGIVERVREILPRERPVYISLDVDALDPAFAPGTAGPAAGGFSTREVIQMIVEGMEGYQIVGADVVEVLPGMDSPGEITQVAAAEMTYEIISRMVKNGQ